MCMHFDPRHWGVPLNFAHLQERIRQFNGETVTKENFINALRERISTTDIRQVKADVEYFLIDKHEMDVWSNEYFLQLADLIKLE